jgi:hypothetical protein
MNSNNNLKNKLTTVMRDYCGSLERLDKIAGIIDGAKLRCIVDPAKEGHNNTVKREITPEELQEIYKLASGKKL